jgi:hypothetical protein
MTTRNHQHCARPSHQVRPEPEGMDTEADEALGCLRDMYAAHTLFRCEVGLAPALVRDTDGGLFPP